MRILSLHPAGTELLFALGAGGMIVGRCDGCDYPETALTIPSIGDAAEMTAERAAILEPDLIVLGPGQEGIAARLAPRRPLLLRFATLEGSLEELRSLARTVGKDVEGDVLVHDLRTAFEHAREKTARFRRTRVYAEAAHSPPAVSTLVNELVAIAGGEAFAGEATPERVREFDPFLIIVSAPGEGASFDPAMIAARAGWEDLSAVRNDRVFPIDDALLHRPGPRLAQGVKLLAKILHGVTVNGS